MRKQIPMTQGSHLQWGLSAANALLHRHPSVCLYVGPLRGLWASPEGWGGAAEGPFSCNLLGSAFLTLK